VAVQKNHQVAACTISSLVSLEISVEKPKVLFVLKKESLTGNLIGAQKVFTISLLANDQVDVAKEFSSNNPGLTNVTEASKSIEFIGNQPLIHNSVATWFCYLIKVETNYDGDMYIAGIEGVRHSRDRLPLIYLNRNYVIS
jgi:flavin reductase (DIM6/NTAB) family NADH-FMN oxidoreductase RutF